MNAEIMYNIVISVVIAIGSGIVSSFFWWLITRRICFPTLDVDRNITADINGNKTIKIKNAHKHYGAYDITCYIDCLFTYKQRPFKCSLKPRSIYYIKALQEEEISVKLPVREINNKDGSKELLSDAFYQSTDGKLYVKIVFQNKYGVRRSIPTTFVVEREIEKVSED